MSFLDSIFSIVWDISDWFYEAYLEVADWIAPFYLLSWPLYWIYLLFYDMLTPIAQTSDWAYNLQQSIADFLSGPEIMSLLQPWLNWAAWSWEWIQDAAYYVSGIVDNWWSSTALTVQYWIDQVRVYAEILVAAVQSQLSTLQAAWNSFVGKIPTIDEVISWWGSWSASVLGVISAWWTGAIAQVQELINTAFIVREDLWYGWTDFRENVMEFFTDPLEFLWSKAADWFLGPEV